MDRLTIPKVGDGTSAKWAKQVVDEIRRQEIIPGNGIKKTVTANGTVLSLDLPKKSAASGEMPDPSLDSCFPVFITGYNGPAYKGARYKIVGKNYPAGQEIESDALYFPHVTPQTVLPMGCTVLAHRISAPLIESSQE